MKRSKHGDADAKAVGGNKTNTVDQHQAIAMFLSMLKNQNYPLAHSQNYKRIVLYLQLNTLSLLYKHSLCMEEEDILGLNKKKKAAIV